VERLGEAGRNPLVLAQALTDFANESGGTDNITVALARVGETHTVEAPETTKGTP
jgi:serine/threonine protein phosphatase PrpC